MAFKLKDTSLYKKSSRRNSCAFKTGLGGVIRVMPRGSLGNITGGPSDKQELQYDYTEDLIKQDMKDGLDKKEIMKKFYESVKKGPQPKPKTA